MKRKTTKLVGMPRTELGEQEEREYRKYTRRQKLENLGKRSKRVVLKMDKKMKEVIKSYLRGILVAVTPLLATHTTDTKIYAFAVVSAALAPIVRWLDKNDPAFGRVTDKVETKLAKPTIKKKTK